jgi:hypothetical protein
MNERDVPAKKETRAGFKRCSKTKALSVTHVIAI